MNANAASMRAGGCLEFTRACLVFVGLIRPFSRRGMERCMCFVSCVRAWEEKSGEGIGRPWKATVFLFQAGVL